MLILFFDTFIISDLGKGGYYNWNHMERVLSQYRDEFDNYCWKKKIDIVKYTLASYSLINWDRVIIRFECENEFDTIPFTNYCRELFPNGIIENKRSATAVDYYESLLKLDNGNNPWIFFSPNNDHPYISNPMLIFKFLDYAEDLEIRFKNNDVCLLYSHFTESMIDNRITDPQWGYYRANFKKIVFENSDIIATTSNKLLLDSIKVFRLNYLVKLFKGTKNNGRVIRLEDTEFYMSNSKGLITIAPRQELCRHYDSYAHLMKWVPPLFIPTGFFEFDIKIRFGYEYNIEGWVNVNPNKSLISTQTDLCCFLEDIPSFWENRISVIDVNPYFHLKVNREDSTFYKYFVNPFHKKSKKTNIIRSIFVWVVSFFIPLAKILRIYSILRLIGHFKKKVCS